MGCGSEGVNRREPSSPGPFSHQWDKGMVFAGTEFAQQRLLPRVGEGGAERGEAGVEGLHALDHRCGSMTIVPSDGAAADGRTP